MPTAFVLIVTDAPTTGNAKLAPELAHILKLYVGAIQLVVALADGESTTLLVLL